MKRSAAMSSASVVTPGRTFARSMLRQRASTRPASAIFSISSGVLRMITGFQRTVASRLGGRVKKACVRADRPGRGSGRRLQLFLHPQRGHGRADVVVHLARRAGAVEAAEYPHAVVVLFERLGLLVVDRQSLLHRLGLVVVALDQPGAVLVADALVLRGVEPHVVEV